MNTIAPSKPRPPTQESVAEALKFRIYSYQDEKIPGAAEKLRAELQDYLEKHTGTRGEEALDVYMKRYAEVLLKTYKVAAEKAVNLLEGDFLAQGLRSVIDGSMVKQERQHKADMAKLFQGVHNIDF